MLAGSSVTVTGEIAELFLPELVKSLSGEFKGIRDPHLILMAADDALIYYFDHSTKFDPTRSDLSIYLRLLAKSRLLNSLRAQKDSEGRKIVVEVDDIETVNIVAAQSEPDAEAALISLGMQEDIMQQVEKFITDPIDLRLTALMVENIRDTSEYAKIMGIIDRPIIEQRRLVKRAKDRIKKVLERKIKTRRPQ